ncbi:hypothetical protein MBLNU457_6236t1 [Dothideomycetes sp. NU457]
MAFETRPGASGVEATPAIDVEAWTVEQAAHALAAATISSPPPRGQAEALEISLDSDPVPKEPVRTSVPVAEKRERVHTVYRRRSSIQRDSLRRRELLLKGKEGSRRRQRWENDRLLNNPHAQPPLPSDWEVRPTYPVATVPYFLAPLWDAEFKATSAAKAKQEIKKTQFGRTGDARTHGTKEEQEAARIPAELRAKLKKSRGARNMLQDLENEIRSFVGAWEERLKALEDDEFENALESDSDEEIVFVGRDGAMSDERKKERTISDLKREKMVFESSVGDSSAAFGRWLVHSIGTYYGLETWSVTTGNPARREAYVGLKEPARSPSKVDMPRPLWGLV